VGDDAGRIQNWYSGLGFGQPEAAAVSVTCAPEPCATLGGAADRLTEEHVGAVTEYGRLLMAS